VLSILGYAIYGGELTKEEIDVMDYKNEVFKFLEKAILI